MSSPNPSVAIVTPIHNGKVQTLRFLESVKSLSYPVTVFIVDDGSTDGSAEAISHEHPGVKIIQGDGNLWWSGATNLGIEKALQMNCNYVFTVNNDVILDPDCIKASVECAQENPGSLVGSIIYYLKQPDTVWYFGARFNSSTFDVEPIGGKNGEFTEITEAEMLTGMGILIPADAFGKIGKFDAKNLPQYLADSDFSLRAKRDGYRLLVTPASKIYNDVESSWTINQIEKRTWKYLYEVFFAKRSPYDFSTRYHFYKKHWGAGYLLALVKFYGLFLRSFYIPHVLSLTKQAFKRIFFLR